MASIDILIFILIVLCATAMTKDFVKVECKTKNVGHYGQQSLLECVVKTAEIVTDPTIRIVAWKKLAFPEDEGDVVLGFKEGNLDQPKRGYGFAEPSWNDKNMNVSLLITDTAVADDGYYSCMVITDSGVHTSVTTLKVQARYSVPTVHSIPEKIVPNTDSTLVCESHGGYPKGTLRWYGEEENDWTKSSEMEVTQSDDGLFQLTSRLPLFRGSTFPKYTCVVFNASGSKVDEITFETNMQHHLGPSEIGRDQPGVTSKVVAPLVVIGSLIVGLLCVLLLRRRRFQQARRNSSAPLTSRDAVSTYEQDVEEGDRAPEDESLNQDLS